MCNSAYISQDFEPLFIAESSSQGKAEKPEKPEWPDDEIVKIRASLRRLAVLRTSNSDDVEDLVQDTLLTLLAKPPATQLEKGLLAWSIGILRNKIGNYYHHRYKRHVPIESVQAGDICRTEKSLFPGSPEAKFSQKELKAIVSEKVAELPPAQRVVMELLVNGLESGEIASRLQPESYQNVINRLHRGRQKLAKELAKYGYGPGSLTGMRRAKGRHRQPDQQ